MASHLTFFFTGPLVVYVNPAWVYYINTETMSMRWTKPIAYWN